MRQFQLTEKTKNWVYVSLQIMIIILAVAVGYFGHNLISIRKGEYELLDQAKGILVKNSILEVPSDEELQHGMIQGMLETLNDPFTFFVDPAAHEIQTDQLTGRFGGIGVRLEQDTDMNWRLYPFPESPALIAGVEDGDILIGVDGFAVTKETDDITLIAALRGPVGEEVNISVQRGDETFDFRIEQEDVPLPSVSWNLLPEVESIGLVKINRISETTADEIESAIQDLIDQGATSFILDLQNNGGGLVESGVSIVNLFLKEGEVLYQQMNKDEEEVFYVKQPGLYSNIPMVVLVNGNTASSAEIIAGAIMKFDRAPIVGSQTYGKTSIQYIFDLKDGSSIHITSGRWWIPGISFPLQPEYAIEDDPSGVTIIQKAVEILQQE